MQQQQQMQQQSSNVGSGLQATTNSGSASTSGPGGVITTVNNSNSNNNNINNNNTIQVSNLFWSKQAKTNAELFALTYGSLVAELVKDYDYDINKIQDELDRMGHSIGIRCIEEVLAKSVTSTIPLISGTLVSSATSIAAANIQQDNSTDNTSATAGSSPLLSNTAKTFYESADLVKIAFRMFFGIIVDCSIVIIDPKQQQQPSTNINNSSNSSSSTTTTTTTISLAYCIKFYDNPLTIFVELPEEYRKSSTTGTSSNNNNSGLEYSQLLAGMVRGMLEMLQLDCNCYFTSSTLNTSYSNTSSNQQQQSSDYNEIRVELKQILQDGAGDEYHDE